MGACCYDPSVDHSAFGRSCIAPGQTAGQSESVRYGCNERVVNSGKQCGTRNFPAPARGLQHGEASPGEFPWTCLVSEEKAEREEAERQRKQDEEDGETVEL